MTVPNQTAKIGSLVLVDQTLYTRRHNSTLRTKLHNNQLWNCNKKFIMFVIAQTTRSPNSTTLR